MKLLHFLKIFYPKKKQIALQLAYYRIHGKAGSTYTSASTRKFYNGRTETCRACTKETMDFVKAIIESPNDYKNLYKVLARAIQKFTDLMNDAMNGKGIDRHLFGLQLIGDENFIPLADIFKDPIFKKSGGFSDFVLSSSCLGYSLNFFPVMPPFVLDGYSCFYAISNSKMSITCTTFKNCPETQAMNLYNGIFEALMDLKKILENGKVDQVENGR